MRKIDYLWLLVPGIVIGLIILSVIYVPGEKIEPDNDGRIENCGPGGTTC